MWPFILIAVVAFAAIRFFQSLSKLQAQHDPISRIPLIDDILDESTRRMKFAKGAKHVYQEGYRKFKNGLFRVSSPRGMECRLSIGMMVRPRAGLILTKTQTESTVIVVSPHFMKELSALPDDQVSFHGALKEVSTFVRSSYVESQS